MVHRSGMFNHESMLGSVIQVTGAVQFKDSLRTRGLPGCPVPGQGQGQIPTCLVPHICGIKLQQLCGVRIESA